MLPTQSMVQVTNIQLRCGACRYFSYDSCRHSTARLDGEETKTGECPHFRFAQDLIADRVA
jgi:hypothetical protein